MFAFLGKEFPDSHQFAIVRHFPADEFHSSRRRIRKSIETILAHETEIYSNRSLIVQPLNIHAAVSLAQN